MINDYNAKYNGKIYWMMLNINIHRTEIHKLVLNSMWPNDATWQQRSGSTLAQVMAWCLTATSHYLNQCWQISIKFPRGQWVNWTWWVMKQCLQYKMCPNYDYTTLPKRLWCLSLFKSSESYDQTSDCQMVRVCWIMVNNGYDILHRDSKKEDGVKCCYNDKDKIC